MKKFSLKWKLFLVASYLQLILYFLLAIIYVTSFAQNEVATFDSTLVVAITMFLISILIAVLNIYILNRFFPDSPLTKPVKNCLRIARVLAIIQSFFLIILGIVAVSEYSEVNTENRMANTIALCLVIFLWLTGLYTLILQFKVSGFLRRNNAAKMNSLINSIGN